MSTDELPPLLLSTPRSSFIDEKVPFIFQLPPTKNFRDDAIAIIEN